MSRLIALKRLALASLAAGGLVLACRAATPGEAPPLAPRPDLGQPANPVPGAPDPIDPPDPGTPGPSIPSEDAGPGPIPPVSMGTPLSMHSEIRASAEVMQTPTPRDAGATTDAARPDASSIDAAARDAAPIDASTVAPRDGRVPDARDSGVTGLPPVPDAQMPVPGDAARPLR